MYKIMACLILMFCLFGCGACIEQEVDLKLVTTLEGCKKEYDV